MNVVQWVEEGSSEKEFYEGTFVKVIGSMRTQVDKRLGQVKSGSVMRV